MEANMFFKAVQDVGNFGNFAADRHRKKFLAFADKGVKNAKSPRLGTSLVRLRKDLGSKIIMEDLEEPAQAPPLKHNSRKKDDEETRKAKKRRRVSFADEEGRDLENITYVENYITSLNNAEPVCVDLNSINEQEEEVTSSDDEFNGEQQVNIADEFLTDDVMRGPSDEDLDAIIQEINEYYETNIPNAPEAADTGYDVAHSDSESPPNSADKKPDSRPELSDVADKELDSSVVSFAPASGDDGRLSAPDSSARFSINITNPAAGHGTAVPMAASLLRAEPRAANNNIPPLNAANEIMKPAQELGDKNIPMTEQSENGKSPKPKDVSKREMELVVDLVTNAPSVVAMATQVVEETSTSASAKPSFSASNESCANNSSPAASCRGRHHSNQQHQPPAAAAAAVQQVGQPRPVEDVLQLAAVLSPERQTSPIGASVLPLPATVLYWNSVDDKNTLPGQTAAATSVKGAQLNTGLNKADSQTNNRPSTPQAPLYAEGLLHDRVLMLLAVANCFTNSPAWQRWPVPWQQARIAQALTRRQYVRSHLNYQRHTLCQLLQHTQHTACCLQCWMQTLQQAAEATEAAAAATSAGASSRDSRCAATSSDPTSRLQPMDADVDVIGAPPSTTSSVLQLVKSYLQSEPPAHRSVRTDAACALCTAVTSRHRDQTVFLQSLIYLQWPLQASLKPPLQLMPARDRDLNKVTTAQVNERAKMAPRTAQTDSTALEPITVKNYAPPNGDSALGQVQPLVETTGNQNKTKEVNRNKVSVSRAQAEKETKQHPLEATLAPQITQRENKAEAVSIPEIKLPTVTSIEPEELHSINQLNNLQSYSASVQATRMYRETECCFLSEEMSLPIKKHKAGKVSHLSHANEQTLPTEEKLQLTNTTYKQVRPNDIPNHILSSRHYCCDVKVGPTTAAALCPRSRSWSDVSNDVVPAAAHDPLKHTSPPTTSTTRSRGRSQEALERTSSHRPRANSGVVAKETNLVGAANKTNSTMRHKQQTAALSGGCKRCPGRAEGALGTPPAGSMNCAAERPLRRVKLACINFQPRDVREKLWRSALAKRGVLLADVLCGINCLILYIVTPTEPVAAKSVKACVQKESICERHPEPLEAFVAMPMAECTTTRTRTHLCQIPLQNVVENEYKIRVVIESRLQKCENTVYDDNDGKLYRISVTFY